MVWFTPDGREMQDHDWAHATSVGMWLNGALAETDARGNPVVGPTVLVLVHPGGDDLDWVLPPEEWGETWRVRVDTTAAGPAGGGALDPLLGGAHVRVGGRSVVVLERQTAV